MNYLTFILILSCSLAGLGQSTFIKNGRACLAATDSLYTFVRENHLKGDLSLTNDSLQKIREIIAYHLADQNKNRADTFQESLILDQTATYLMQHTSKIKTLRQEQRYNLNKRIDHIIINPTRSFGLTETYTFTIPLIKRKGVIHRNEEPGTNEFNLYQGKHQPRPNKKDQETQEEIPVPALSYENLNALVLLQMKRIGLIRMLQGNTVSSFGLQLELDSRSLKLNRTPVLKVIIILGIKRSSYKGRRSFQRKLQRAGEKAAKKEDEQE